MAKFMLLFFCFITYSILCFGDPPRYLFDTNMYMRTNGIRPGPRTQNETHELPVMPEVTEVDMSYLSPVVCSCTDIYAPLCGSNGQSYYNECEMHCELGLNTEVTVLHQGNCIPF